MSELPTIRIRQSEITKFLRCKRSWYLGYYLGLEPDWSERVKPRSYDVGNAVHAGLKAYYLGGTVQEGIDQWWAEVSANLAEHADMKEWEKTLREARATAGYFPTWAASVGDESGEETVLVEEELKAEVLTYRGYRVLVHGTPDRIIRDSVGLQVLDWKTVSTIDAKPGLVTNWQLWTYATLVAIVLNEIPYRARHVDIKRSMHTARAKGPFVLEHEIPLSRIQLDNHWIHLTQIVKQIVDTRLALDEGGDENHHFQCVPSPNMNCSWDCSFNEICPMMDDGSDYEHVLSVRYRPRTS